MRRLKQSLVVLTTGICIAAAAAAMAVELDTPEKSWAREQKLYALVIESLVADGTPRSLTLAASKLLPKGENARAIGQMQRDLFERAAQMAPDDAWVQWIAALNAGPAGGVSQPVLALQRLESGNGAVWLFRLQAASRAKDSQGITEALARMGAARSYENPYVATVLEWLKFYRSHPIPLPLAETVTEVPSARVPLYLATGHAAPVALAMPMPFYAPIVSGNCISTGPLLPPDRREDWGLMSACNSSDHPLLPDRRDACLAVGRLMLSDSNTLDSMRIGAALLRDARAEGVVEITRNTDYFTQKYFDRYRSAMQDPDEFARFQADWLQTRNEIQIARNMLTRAGIPLLPPKNWDEDPFGNLARFAKQKGN